MRQEKQKKSASKAEVCMYVCMHGYVNVFVYVCMLPPCLLAMYAPIYKHACMCVGVSFIRGEKCGRNGTKEAPPRAVQRRLSAGGEALAELLAWLPTGS